MLFLSNFACKLLYMKFRIKIMKALKYADLVEIETIVFEL